MTSPSPADQPPVGDPGPTLLARTVAVPLPHVEDLLALLPEPEDVGDVVSWVRRGEGFVGWGRVATFSASGPDRFAEAQEWWRRTTAEAIVRDDVQEPGTGPMAFGSMAFSRHSESDSVLVVPEVVVGRRGSQAWITTMTRSSTVPPADVLLRRQPAPQGPGPVGFEDGDLGVARWSRAVDEAVARISTGELDKVVLARSVRASAGRRIDPRWVLRRLTADYDTTWVFAVDGLLGATPEMLVRLERGLVTSRVLAGTIRRSGDDGHDLALAGSLARSSKDLEEHEYAVRSVADALAEHTSSINVPESPFVLHLNNVMHLATDVAGVVDDDSTALGLAASLHPSAAVCGTPTPVADDVIAELESMDRGRYAGPVGWMDASGDGEWGIALRCGVYEDPTSISLYAGCGIVAGSRAEDEVAESVAKLLPMRTALGG